MPADRQNNSAKQPSNFILLCQLFKKHYMLLLFPVALFSATAAAYIVTSKPTWKATQSLQIRDELALQTVMPGRFDSLDMMKMVQETIHDTVRRQAVVSKVLNQMEPPEDYEHPSQWPTINDIEGLQNSISLTPPNGAEFGRTEVLLLSVKSGSVERAKKIVGLLAVELQNQLNQLRDKRAVGIENELSASVKLAQKDLQDANLELAEFEKDLGDIIVDLRSISSDLGGGSSGLQSQKGIILAEIRAAKQKLEILRKQLSNIKKASEDPNHVLSFSSELLVAQPALQKLKEQLINIQSSTAKTLGQFEVHHPKAKAALEAEKVVMQKIREEIQVAANGLAGQVSVAEGQLDRLNESKRELDQQFLRLAEVRAPYSSLLKMVAQKRTVLNKSLDELARANSQRAAVNTTNLITLIDEPYSGSKPEGTSKKIILGAAGFAGLISGIGLVFFAASPSFVGPLNENTENENGSRDSVLEQRPSSNDDWRHESLARANPTGKTSSKRPLRKHRHEDLDIQKVDFSDDLDVDALLADDVKLADPAESTKTESPEETEISNPRVEAFKLQPKKHSEEPKVDKSKVDLKKSKKSNTRVEPFKLEPKKVNNSDSDEEKPEENTDSNLSETFVEEIVDKVADKTVDAVDEFDKTPIDKTELDEFTMETESKLQEEHRKRIERMFEED